MPYIDCQIVQIVLTSIVRHDFVLGPDISSEHVNFPPTSKQWM